jgi:ribonuclease P protein component
MKTGANTFSKQERLCGQKLIDRLFTEGNRQISAFPIRLVWLLSDYSEFEGVRILISAPKRNFHHAVDRNRIKRQIREFYRTSSAPLKEAVASRNKGLALAFLFNDNKLWDTDKLQPKLQAVMDRLTNAVQEEVESQSGKSQEK